MDRIHYILTITVILCLTLCLSCEQKEFLPDLPNTKIDFQESVGKYFHVFDKSDLDEINYFGRSLGDSIIFEIKPDSTFYFNHFYYDGMKKIDHYQGKINTGEGFNGVEIQFPKDAKFGNQGFVRSKEGLYFYTRLKMKGFENYEYQLFYKKIK